MQNHRLFKSLLLVTVGILATASQASANTWPPMAVLLLSWPFLMSFFSYGFGLVAIVLVETLTVVRELKIAKTKALWVTIFVNLASVVVGLGLVIFLASFPYHYYSNPTVYRVIYISIFLGFGWLSSQFWQRVGLKPLQWHPIVWSGVWAAIAFGEFGLIGLFNKIHLSGGNFPDPRVPFYMNMVQLLVVIAYFSVGFLLTVISEGFYLGRSLPDVGNGQLLKTVMIMNVRSYAYVAFPLTLLGLFLRQQGWWIY